ncbi:MAG: B12-binding domain-containing radical SAM protein, partial [Candidatus Micrarchaeia archaeon]
MADVVLVHLWGVHNEYPPLGLGYLAAIAIEEGLSAKIIDPTTDPSFSLEKFSKILQKENPKFVCFGLYTSYVIESFKMAKTARATMPNAIIIAGGPHANATLSQTLKDCLEFDVLVHGEGEETFREIIQNKAFGEIKGILFRKNGRIVKNPLRPFIQNLDSLPFPARQLFSKNYVYDVCFQEKPVANIVTSRGCPYACIFCSKETFGTVYRQRSVQSAVEEVREIIEVHKFKELFFFEDVFTMNKQWV